MAEELEEILVTSDFGMPTTLALVESLQAQFSSSGATSPEIYNALKQEIATRLKTANPDPPDVAAGPRIIMVVGVNGVGKTTTIGKLASRRRATWRPPRHGYCAGQGRQGTDAHRAAIGKYVNAARVLNRNRPITLLFGVCGSPTGFLRPLPA